MDIHWTSRSSILNSLISYDVFNELSYCTHIPRPANRSTDDEKCHRLDARNETHAQQIGK